MQSIANKTPVQKIPSSANTQVGWNKHVLLDVFSIYIITCTWENWI